MTAEFDSIAESLGYLGIPAIRRGRTVVQAKVPPSLGEVSGFGDTVRVGDVVLVTMIERRATWKSTYPERIEAILSTPNEPTVIHILSRAIDAASQKIFLQGPNSYRVSGLGWKRHFHKLSQADVDAWFQEAKKPLPDGWNPTGVAENINITASGAQVFIENGVPTKVKRASPYLPFASALAEAGQKTGYLLTASGCYEDPEKLIRKIRTAQRLSPPKVTVEEPTRKKAKR